ncbi:transposase-like protein [Rhodococcus sp. 27YEA15]
MSTSIPLYKGHRYPVEIINHCVWLYFRFPLSFREVEELMLERGVVVSYETIRRWCDKFGQAYANQLRRQRARPGDTWHLDEVFIRINGSHHYLWRAVDQHGNVLDVLAQSHRNGNAAKRFFRKLLKGLQYAPRVIVTDKLTSYSVAHREILASVEHRRSKYFQQPGREFPSTDPTTRAGDETLHITWACAAVPVRVRRHLTARPAQPTQALGAPMAYRDGRPIRALAGSHRDCRRLKVNDPEVSCKFCLKLAALLNFSIGVTVPYRVGSEHRAERFVGFLWPRPLS